MNSIGSTNKFSDVESGALASAGKSLGISQPTDGQGSVVPGKQSSRDYSDFYIKQLRWAMVLGCIYFWFVFLTWLF